MDKPEKRKQEGVTTERNNENASGAADKRRKVIGPSLPPPQAVESSEEEEGDSDSDDDGFGPSLPPPKGALPAVVASSDAPPNSSYRDGGSKDIDAESSKPQRDAWMLLPPSELDRGSRVDPTKLRNRKFQTGRAAQGSSASAGGVDAAWTETPEEKMKRLQNEALGISSKGGGGGGDVGARERESKSSEAMREKIQRYNEEKRRDVASQSGGHGKEKEEEEDDPSSRAFDKEKDMALSSKLTHAQRRELIKKSSDFGSRFTTGKFL